MTVKPSANRLFDLIVPTERLNPSLRAMLERPGHEPAIAKLAETFQALPKPDGNFIKDFQSTGFDSRVWELYLHAFATECGFMVSQPFERPDFLWSTKDSSVWVEATTAHDTDGVSPPLPADTWELEDALAVRLGSPLLSKLRKRYVELPHVRGKPLVLAIQNFAAGGLDATSSALQRYLYGTHAALASEPGQPVEYIEERLANHVSQHKTIPSGFFHQPDASQISAVLFSNAGTVGKFNRMGFQAQAHPHMRLLRYGFRWDPTPTAIAPHPFAYVVGDREETWGEEVIMFHNPDAAIPLSRSFFPNVVQYWAEGYRLLFEGTDFFPFLSKTLGMPGRS